MTVQQYASLIDAVAAGATWDNFNGTKWKTNTDPESLPTYAQFKVGQIRLTPLPAQTPFYAIWVNRTTGALQALDPAAVSPGGNWVLADSLVIVGTTLAAKYYAS